MSPRVPPRHVRAAVVAGTVLVAAWLARRSLEAPAVAPERAAELLSLHRALFEDVPRPAGSEAAARARARIADALREAGCPPREQTAWRCLPGRCARITNLWCRLPGREGGPAVVGLAHTDSAPASPGAADDGAGVVAWVAAVRALGREELRRPFVLVLTDGEELGLLGAGVWFRDPPLPDPIGEVVNLEARGTGGASFLFETVGPARPWGRWYAATGLRPNASSLYPAVYDRLPNDTDLSVVGAVGIAGVNHAFVENLPQYHTALDDRAHLDPRSLAQHADAALAWVRALQDAGEPAAAAATTYTDVVGLVLLRWPTSLGVAGAVGAVVAWLGWLGTDLWRGQTRAAAVAASGGALLALGVGAAVIAEGLGAPVSAAAGPAWWGRPWPLRGAVWCATAACTLGLGRVGDEVARWHAATALAVGGGAALVAVDLRLAVLFLPAATFGLAWRTGWARRPEIGVLGLAPALALAWFPLAMGLEEALTLRHPAVVAVPLVVALAGAAVVAPARPGRWAGALLGAAAVLAAIGAAGPAFTAERPQPSAVVVTERPGVAGVEVRAFAMLGGPDGEVQRVATPLGLPAPAAAWLDRTHLRIAPVRGGTLEVRADARYRLEGTGRWQTGRTAISGAGADGVVVEFTAPPGAVGIAEETPGLPAWLDRDALFDGPAVPAHDGDRTRVEVEVRWADVPPG